MTDTPVKKILYLITKSNLGGAQKYVLELATAAQQSGMEVVVAHGGSGKKDAQVGLLKTRLDEAAVRTVTIAAFMRDVSILRDLKAFFEVYAVLRHERPDVLHVSSSKAGGIGAAAGRLARVPRIIFTSHGLTMDETWRPRWQRILITLFTWLTFRLAHHSIMITTETYERVRRMPGLMHRVSLIFNGIRPTTSVDRVSARTTLAPDLTHEAIWVGGIGELHKNKNWSVVIQALTSLPPQVHLIIIGEGDERSQLTQLAAQRQVLNRVHLLGFIADAPRFLSAFDVFILPSLKEGLPYVLLEAGHAGVPVIASDLPGIRDIITPDQTGIILTPTPEVIAAAITRILETPHEGKHLATALQSQVAHTFSIERMTTETFSLYDSHASLTIGARCL